MKIKQVKEAISFYTNEGHFYFKKKWNKETRKSENTGKVRYIAPTIDLYAQDFTELTVKEAKKLRKMLNKAIDKAEKSVQQIAQEDK